MTVIFKMFDKIIDSEIIYWFHLSKKVENSLKLLLVTLSKSGTHFAGKFLLNFGYSCCADLHASLRHCKNPFDTTEVEKIKYLLNMIKKRQYYNTHWQMLLDGGL